MHRRGTGEAQDSVFFSFPCAQTKSAQRAKWIARISRISNSDRGNASQQLQAGLVAARSTSKWEPSKSAKVCGRHFISGIAVIVLVDTAAMHYFVWLL